MRMFIINYFYELPEEIQVYIKKIKSVNTIIYKYKKYSEYMESILHFVDKLEFRSIVDMVVPTVDLCCLLLLGLKTKSIRVGWENILTLTFRSLYEMFSRNFTLNEYEKMVYRRTYNYANKLYIKLNLSSSYCDNLRLQLAHEFSYPHIFWGC
jgi:hypothetical protein